MKLTISSEIGQKLTLAALALSLHLLGTALHTIPHAKIPVPLSPRQWVFVLLVIGLAPVIGFRLMWWGAVRSGAAIFTLSMAAAFVFGVSYHFVLPTPTHVLSVPDGPWQFPFQLTAGVLTVIDAGSAVVGAWIWHDLEPQNTSAVPIG